MVLLDHSKYTTARLLFVDNAPHSRSFTGSVIENRQHGALYLAPNGKAGLLTTSCEFHYFAGAVTHETLESAANIVRDKIVKPSEEVFFFPFSMEWETALRSRMPELVLRKYWRFSFTFDKERFNLLHSNWQTRLSPSVAIRYFSKAECDDHDVNWIDKDDFRRRGLGITVEVDNQTASRCHAMCLGDNKAEISIETNPSFFRKGYATLAACAFIDKCMEQGIEPCWSCWSTNEPSRKTAISLGFRQSTLIPVLYASSRTI